MKKKFLLLQLTSCVSALFAQESIMSMKDFMNLHDPFLFSDAAKSLSSEELNERVAILNTAYEKYINPNEHQKDQLTTTAVLLSNMQDLKKRMEDIEDQNKKLQNDNSKLIADNIELRSSTETLKEKNRLLKIFLSENIKAKALYFKTDPVHLLEASLEWNNSPPQDAQYATNILTEMLDKNCDTGRLRFISSKCTWNLDVIFTAFYNNYSNTRGTEVFSLLFENFKGSSYGNLVTIIAESYKYRLDVIDALIKKIGKNAPVHGINTSDRYYERIYTGNLDLQGLVDRIYDIVHNTPEKEKTGSLYIVKKRLIAYALFFTEKYSLNPNPNLNAMIDDEMMSAAIEAAHAPTDIPGASLRKEMLECLMKNKQNCTPAIYWFAFQNSYGQEFLIKNFTFDSYGNALLIAIYDIYRSINKETILRNFIEKTGGLDAPVHNAHFGNTFPNSYECPQYLPMELYCNYTKFRPGNGYSARQIISKLLRLNDINFDKTSRYEHNTFNMRALNGTIQKAAEILGIKK